MQTFGVMERFILLINVLGMVNPRFARLGRSMPDILANVGEFPKSIYENLDLIPVFGENELAGGYTSGVPGNQYPFGKSYPRI